jgi:hypothetical protein
MSKAKHVNEVMTDLIRRWPTPAEARDARIEARNKWMPRICRILDIEFVPMGKMNDGALSKTSAPIR